MVLFPTKSIALEWFWTLCRSLPFLICLGSLPLPAIARHENPFLVNKKATATAVAFKLPGRDSNLRPID